MTSVRLYADSMAVVCPLLTLEVAEQLRAAVARGASVVDCSLDLGRNQVRVELTAAGWQWQGQTWPLPEGLRERTVYTWDGERFAPVSRYSGALIKLVPTEWGPPIFEIDGIKMLPSARVSPLEDARRKVNLVEPRGRQILDTCAGLGYFAVCCLEAGATSVRSFEKNAEVLWLRTLNPWSPQADKRLTLTHADVTTQIATLGTNTFDAILHDPPRFGIAGELYSQQFYGELARVLRPRGRMFHYTGAPNKISSGRDVPGEVIRRLGRAGFESRREGDGVLAVRKRFSSG
jgi:uncharacterized protein